MKFETLVGKRAVGKAHVADYSTWAESLLHEGEQPESVAVLAGLGVDKYTDTQELERYFQKAVKELGLSLPAEELAKSWYAVEICRKMVGGDLDLYEGIAVLQAFHEVGDDFSEFKIWDELSEDLWLLEEGGYGCVFNSELTAGNSEEFILAVAKQFIELCDMRLPKGFYAMSVCDDCGNIGLSVSECEELSLLSKLLDKIRNRSSVTCRAVCSTCRSVSVRSMSDYKVRELYLNRCLSSR